MDIPVDCQQLQLSLERTIADFQNHTDVNQLLYNCVRLRSLSLKSLLHQSFSNCCTTGFFWQP